MSGWVGKSNPRSKGRFNDEFYQKSTDKQSLSIEASELIRCDQLQLKTEKVYPVEYVEFDGEKTLTTKKISGVELFNVLWNGTSRLHKIIGRNSINSEYVAGKISALGAWLSIYHRSSYEHSFDVSASMWIKQSFQKKLDKLVSIDLLTSEFAGKITNTFVEPLAA
ncbi:MAG: hypothetical protein LAT66_13445, partial [Alkalimonas sp.]|nr:hypothetical protein [Alkalimonas sp.]